ncbi:MAG: SIMPL domain-containing protein [Halioglobus sp.]
MQKGSKASAFILGVFIATGLSVLGFLLATAAIEYKQFDRSVTVKGLSEREFGADIIIWPIQFTVPENNLEKLYALIESNTAKIRAFLLQNGVNPSEVTISAPNITDKAAQQYGNSARPEFRYTAVQTVTVYSQNVEAIRALMGSLSELGKQGIVLTSGNYESQTEYIFNRLNEVKPEMIEEATRQAREVAEKFASDSNSKLGKIKTASQGQFTISDRDKNNPHIKRVRVVSTVEYYLSD